MWIYGILLSDGSGPETRVSGFGSAVKNMGLRLVEAAFFFFCQIFGIFNDFSKFYSAKILEKSSEWESTRITA